MKVISALQYNEWEDKVRATIAEDWLELIDGNEELSNKFSMILQSLHKMYKPMKDGSWSASPRWPDMFNWTSCPLDMVRAIILLKKPKAVSNVGRSSDYVSTGIAAGVKRKDGSSGGQQISDIWTVDAMMEVALLCLKHGDEDLGSIVRGKYQAGFNPEYLSKKGILFLNVALTSGHIGQIKVTDDRYDVTLWQEFTLGLLYAMPMKKIPLFQWYITMHIEDCLNDLENNGTIVVSKPDDLLLGPKYHKHICYFNSDQLNKHAMALRAKKYEAHRAILKKIIKSMVCESGVQTYKITEGAERGIKRRADDEVENGKRKRV